MKAEIGFSHGAPENPETKWREEQDDGSTVIYTKTCVEDVFFIYTCECIRGDSKTKTSWQTSSDMTEDEVEQIPRFLDLLEGKI
jgi:hypothetical protein